MSKLEKNWFENGKIAYIIGNNKDGCYFLSHDGEKFIWDHKENLKGEKLLINRQFPSIFENIEDAYGFAYNVAKLKTDEFKIEKMWYNI